MTTPPPTVRPPSELILTTPEHLVAVGFGAGLAPVGPGTVGTLVAVPLWFVLFWLPLSVYAVALAVLFVVGCAVCGKSAHLLGVADYGGIVFDEFVGFWIACTPLIPALGVVQAHLWAWLLAAFALFRLFDIWKPWPISLLDRHVHGGLGIMLDDAVAGLFAGGALLGGAQVLDLVG